MVHRYTHRIGLRGLDRLRAFTLVGTDHLYIPGVQAAIASVVNDHFATKFRQHIAHDHRALASLTSSSGDSAGAWLTATPALRHHRLDDDDFRIASALRLRAPIPIASLPAAPTACSSCGSNTNNLHGDHAFSCQHMRRAATKRHGLLAGAFWWGGLKGHANPRRDLLTYWEEPVATFFPPRAPGHNLRADALIDTAAPGKDCFQRKCIDYMVTHPTGNSGKQRDTVGVAARSGEDGKWRKYLNAHELTKADVIPVVFETFGALGPAGEKFVKDLANLAHPVASFKDALGKTHLLDYDGLRADFIRRLRERLAVTLQRGNATMMRVWASRCFAHAPAVGAAAAEEALDL